MTTPRTWKINRNIDMQGNSMTNVLGVTSARTDIFANRSAAASHSSELFLATDDPVASSGTLYYSNGTSWTMLDTVKSEIGRTSITSASSTSSGTAFTDITSFTLNVTLATPRSIALVLKGPVQNSSAFQIDAQIVVVQSGAQSGWTSNAVVTRQTIPDAAVTAAVDSYVHLRGELDNLAAGSWDFKVQLRAVNGGAAKFNAVTTAGSGGQQYATLSAVLL